MNKKNVHNIIQKVAIIRGNGEGQSFQPMDMRRHIRQGGFVTLDDGKDESDIIVLNMSELYAHMTCKNRGYGYMVSSIQDGDILERENSFVVNVGGKSVEIPHSVVERIGENISSMSLSQPGSASDITEEIAFTMNRVGMSSYLHRKAIYKGLYN